MKYNSTTTLRRIREGSPESGRTCADGYSKLLRYLGKTEADDDPVDLLTVLDSNGLDDALWVLSYAMPDDRLARHFQAWCAEQVVHLFEREFPNDRRVRDQIDMLRNDTATDEQRDAARAGAWAAALDAGRTALDAGRAAWATLDARDAARAARADAWAALDAALTALDARVALDVRVAARAARAADARVALDVRVAARDAQEQKLREMLAE